MRNGMVLLRKYKIKMQKITAKNWVLQTKNRGVILRKNADIVRFCTQNNVYKMQKIVYSGKNITCVALLTGHMECGNISAKLRQ